MVTVFALMLIFYFSEEKQAETGLLRSASAFTPIYQAADYSQDLVALLAAQRVFNANPSNPKTAIKLSRFSLQMYQSNGNARFLGAAKSALQPWWDVSEPPLEIWLTRGRLLQTEHYFETAAQDLSRLNSSHPGNIEALLLETDAWRRAGRINPAKKACIALAFAGRPDLTLFCTAEILLSLGESKKAEAILGNRLDDIRSLGLGEQAWAWSIYADSLLAIGELDQAERIWDSIAQSRELLLSYKLSYADVLIALSRWQQVTELLAADADKTAALLRLSLAAKNTAAVDYETMRERLAARLEVAAESAAAHLYLREQALYAFWIEEDSKSALEFALLNWEKQKGWEDVELVLTIARSIDDTAALEQIQQWRESFAGTTAL